MSLHHAPFLLVKHEALESQQEPRWRLALLQLRDAIREIHLQARTAGFQLGHGTAQTNKLQ
jgi:hypothetical protein